MRVKAIIDDDPEDPPEDYHDAVELTYVFDGVPVRMYLPSWAYREVSDRLLKRLAGEVFDDV